MRRGLRRPRSLLAFPSEAGEAAVDEVGRGCLACEVVAAAVILPPLSPEDVELLDPLTRSRMQDVQDSKLMSSKKRQEVAAFIQSYVADNVSRVAAFGIGTASASEIDRINIRQATMMAMHRALDDVSSKAPVRKITVDGNSFVPYLDVPHECVVKGDASCLNVAAASILAKVHRDALVREHCSTDPTLHDRYGFNENKAYGTRAHLDGLQRYGASVHHRASFAPVAAAVSTRARHVE